MRIRSLHPWDVSPQEAMAIQLQLRSRLRLHGTGPFATVAGIDVSYDKRSKLMFAGVVVMSGDGQTLLDCGTATAGVAFPYIPGLLSFRETPVVIMAWNGLKTPPDCLICDGHGLAHPRRFGLACHLGLLLGLPSIGCAKSLLVGTYREPGKRRGSVAPLLDQGEQIGVVLQTKDGVAPVFVSQGDRIDLDAAVQTVLATCRGYRLPEPQRRAHLLVTKMRLDAQAGKPISQVGCRDRVCSTFHSNTSCAYDTHERASDSVIASDQRERGNLTVLGVAKNGGIASVAALPRNDAGGGDFLTSEIVKKESAWS